MAEIKIGRMTMGMCQTNCYFLYREGCSEVMLFDPPTAGRQIYDKLKELANKIGITNHQIGPLVRSSYRAAELV